MSNEKRADAMDETIEINGVTYRRVGGNEDARVVVRSRDAGVHVGTLIERTGDVVTLRDAVRIWRWRGANTLHEVAVAGIDSADESSYTRVSQQIAEIVVLGVCEMLPCSAAAWTRISKAGWAK